MKQAGTDWQTAPAAPLTLFTPSLDARIQARLLPYTHLGPRAKYPICVGNALIAREIFAA